MSRLAAILALAVAGCATPEPDVACADLSWDSTARPFLDTWCTPCHSRHVPIEERQGAPAGVDYDRYADVLTHAAAIEARIAGDPPSMPPGGGLPLPARDTFAAWLACDAPGSSTPVEPVCANPTTMTAITTCGDEGIRLDGSLAVTDGADLGCVCEVTGDLVISAEPDLARLARVGGTLRLEGETTRVELPDLGAVGRLEVDAPRLATFAIDRLRAVDESVIVVRAGTARLGLHGIERVGADLVVSGAEGVQRIDLDRLEVVVGDLRFEDLPALQAIEGTHGLEEVGGVVRFEDLPALARLSQFSKLDAPGGELVVRRTGITELRGFDRLHRVPAVTIDDNPALALFDGIADLDHVAGTLSLRNNDALVEITSLVFLRQVDGDLVIDGHDVLEAMIPVTGLSSVGGDVRVTGNPRLPTRDIERALESTTVSGETVIDGNG